MVSQFMKPRGLAGALAGWEMAARSSNRRRNVWAVDLLNIRPEDHVLEIGCGPGVALREISRRATEGSVVGVDHSATMVRQATRRNRTTVRSGRTRVVLGSAEDLPTLGTSFDKVLAVNNMGMWASPKEALEKLRGLMRPGGRIAIVSQPRCPGATSETTHASGREIQERLALAGFADFESHLLDLKPPVVCVIGRA